MRLLIEHATVWDGSGAAPFPGQVLIEGERIEAVAPAGQAVAAAEGAERLDAGGKFLMPGLVEGHAHLSFVDTPRGTALGELPPEDHALLTMDAARKLLGAGFTSACSAAAAKIRLDVAVRDAIERGHTDGPRLLTASPELTVTGGLGDGRRLHLHQDSFGVAVDGPDEVRRMARLCLREGCRHHQAQHLGRLRHRIGAGRDHGHDRRRGRGRRRGRAHDRPPGRRPRTCFRIGEARAAQWRRHHLSLRLRRRRGARHAGSAPRTASSPARRSASCWPAWRACAATIHWQGQGFLERLKPLYEATCRTHNEMRKRGIRIVIGGDYGFAANPQGTNARDLEHFVTHLGFSPSEALQAATRTGGEIMKRGHELGQVKPGFLADLLLVDGDPLKDVRVLQDRKRFAMIMKGGVRYVPCEGAPHVRRLH